MKKWVFILISILLAAGSASAIIFYSTGDTTYNITAPTGDLEGSGWRFQGKFLQYLGTPVGPHHFITAQHFGGSVGNSFIFDGVTYVTTAKISDPDSDLALYEINGTFPRYAPLYSGSDEVGKTLVVFGRGVHRGDPVYLNGDLRGWKWELYQSGVDDLKIRWGQNVVSGTTTAYPGDPNYESPVIQFAFDENGITNECALADKDSGGAVFIQDGQVWKLAGINYTVNPYSYSSDGFSTYYSAALFDYSYKHPTDPEKLYYTDWGVGQSPVRSQTPVPGQMCATRISACYAWITNNVTDFDQDVDGLPDWWETEYAGNPTSMVATNDNDNDNLINLKEYLNGTNPLDVDSDDDSMPDGWEVHNGLAPTNSADAGLDLDSDTLVNSNEYSLGTDPADPDMDGDAVLDGWEYYGTSNTVYGSLSTIITNSDSDADGLSDGVEMGITNSTGYITNPNVSDTDGDTMDDGWEVSNGLNPTNSADGGSADADTDGLANTNEYNLGTDPQDTDTDDDWMPDGWEVDNGFNPTNAVDGGLDFDSDTLVNSNEYLLGTDFADPDMDGDAVLDGWEYFGTSNTVYGNESTIITNADSDADGIPDGVEMGITNSNGYITNPNSAYTDSDSMPDAWEVCNGINPVDGSDDEQDPDGDGFVNSEEWIADTSPTNGSSFLNIGVFTNISQIVFASSTNRQYQIEYRTDLTDSNELWQAEPGLEWFDAVSTQTVKAVSSSGSNRFYRIQVSLP